MSNEQLPAALALLEGWLGRYGGIEYQTLNVNSNDGQFFSTNHFPLGISRRF